MLKGVAASSGIGIGKVVELKETGTDYVPKTVTDTDAEFKRYNSARDKLCGDIRKRAKVLEKTVGKSEADILSGHINIMRDPWLSEEVRKRITDGKCAEQAVESVCDMFITLFSNAEDNIIRQRVDDIKDVKSQLIHILIGKDSGLSVQLPKNAVIVCKELTPSMLAEMNTENVIGIIAENGSVTSHSAILARVMEIPAVLGVTNAVQLLDGCGTVILDGDNGIVIPEPDTAQLESYEKKRELLLAERKELEKYRGKKTFSASKEQYELVCNVGKADDVLNALHKDCEGVGLFRTEFMFMDAVEMPDENEQFEEYKKAAIMLKGKPLTIRTLDIGGDKPISYLDLPKEDNPFMGLRAIRYCLKNRELFKTQLTAIIRASAYGNIKIMLPLITCAEELRESKKLIEEIKQELRNRSVPFDEGIQTGIMAETASAGIIADILAKESDFISIGTNDLTGYTMCCDRGNADVAYLYSVFQPGVLRMIQRIIKCGNDNNIPVGMCGEAAADPMMTPLLISFGLKEFSVSPSSVLKLRKSISCWSKTRADEITARVMSMSTAREITDYLRTVV